MKFVGILAARAQLGHSFEVEANDAIEAHAVMRILAGDLLAERRHEFKSADVFVLIGVDVLDVLPLELVERLPTSVA